jgi:hypothetical protein
MLHDVMDVGRVAYTPADESANVGPQLGPDAFRAQRHVGHSTSPVTPGFAGLGGADQRGRHERPGARRPT